MHTKNAHDAIRYAQAAAPLAIGWDQAASRWQTYQPEHGCPPGLIPELLCVGLGRLPVPLSNEGARILAQLLT